MQCKNPCYHIVSLQMFCTPSACLQDGNAAARLSFAMLNLKDDTPERLRHDSPRKVTANLWEDSCPVVPLDRTEGINHPMQAVGSAVSLLPLGCLLKSSKP